MLNPTGKPFTVTEITQKIKNLLEGSVGTVQITGELSNIRPPSSNGHLYFTIKDAGAQIGAVMFAGNLRAVTFKPENGVKLYATGEICLAISNLLKCAPNLKGIFTFDSPSHR